MAQRPESSRDRRLHRPDPSTPTSTPPFSAPALRAFLTRNRSFVALFVVGVAGILYAAQVLWSVNGDSAETAADHPATGQSSSTADGSPNASSSADPSANPSISPTPGPSASTVRPSSGSVAAPPPPGTCAAGTHVLGGSDGAGACWPGPNNTGVPNAAGLAPYTGSCTITADNTVISAKLITCALRIDASGVVIEKSQINGTVANDGSGGSFTVADSTINVSPTGAPVMETGIGSSNFTVVRTEVIGGNRGIHCEKDCEVRDSWVHGQTITSDWHASAIRMEQNITLVHNAFTCDARITPQDGGCSASLTGYGDFAPVQNNTIQRNLFLSASQAAYCAFGGSSTGKPYSDQAANIHFVDNVFQRGSTGACGMYGPVGDWDPGRPGNTWVNNRYDDGTAIPNKKNINP